MDHICAPWRSEYFGKKEQGCVFCNVVNHPEKDAQTGVLFRAKRCFGIMNLYPYTPGHFMVIPYAHADNIENLEEQTWSEMSAYVREGVKILKRELNAAGVNIGMNLGKAGVRVSQSTCTIISCRAGTAIRTSSPPSPRCA